MEFKYSAMFPIISFPVSTVPDNPVGINRQKAIVRDVFLALSIGHFLMFLVCYSRLEIEGVDGKSQDPHI